MTKKFKPFGRRRYNSLARQWGQRNWTLLAVAGVVCLAILGFLTYLIVVLMPDGALKWWSLGAFHVGALAVTGHLLLIAFLAHEKEAIWQLRGAWGEENTREELNRARRNGHVWGWVDSIQLKTSDIDHLVVTKRGGLVAIDSKWRSQADDIPEMVRSASQAANRAQGVSRNLLRKGPRGRHRSDSDSLHVTPVVVIWGSEQHRVPSGYEQDGVHFVGGRRLCQWLAEFDRESVSETVARDLLPGLEEFRAKAWGASSRTT